MEAFSLFDRDRAGELTIMKDGWLNPVFTLTDGVKVYGKLSYGWDWRRTGKLESARQNWLIRPQKLFTRSFLADDPVTGQAIRIVKTGVWKGLALVEFPDGQTLNFKREGLFSKTHTWFNGQLGNILTIESRLSSYKQPFIVIPGPNTIKNNIDLILMTFIGVHLILQRRSHAAGH